MRVLGLAVMMCVAGCLDLAKVSCGELSCPVGTVCTREGGCAAQADVAACDGLVDGAECKAANGGAGTCEGGACRTGLCGNGVIDVGEACDDGNQVSGDGCRADCGKLEVCGDSQLDTGEVCDDGNHNAADGCDACKRTAWAATTVVGTELRATSTALADPSGIAVDGSGRVFVADLDNHRIVRIELDGSITTVAGTGNPGFSGDGGAATSAQLAAPNAVANDGLGRMFIADTGNQRIRRVELDGTITTLAGTGAQSYGGDGGPAILAQLNTPYGVATDGLGRVLVADTLNHRIRRIDIDCTITTIAAS